MYSQAFVIEFYVLNSILYDFDTEGIYYEHGGKNKTMPENEKFNSN